MPFEFDFSSIFEALKNVFSIGLTLSKAIFNLFLRLWDFISEVVELVRQANIK